MLAKVKAYTDKVREKIYTLLRPHALTVLDDDYYDTQTDPTIFTSPRPSQTQPRKALVLEETEVTETVTTIYTTGMGDKFKEKSIAVAGAFGSYAIAAVLGYGNGFFFADFRNLDLYHFDWWVWLSYFAGFLLEFIAVNILFKSSKFWYEKNYKGFVGTFLIVCLFALGTIITQYLMMAHQLTMQGIMITDSDVNQVPILSLVVGLGGLHGSAGFLIFRAALFHLGEIACIFLVPTRKPDMRETIQRKMEENRQMAELNYQQNFNRLQAHVSNALDGMLSKAISDIERGAAQPVTTPTPTPVWNTVVRQETPAHTPTPTPVHIHPTPVFTPLTPLAPPDAPRSVPMPAATEDTSTAPTAPTVPTVPTPTPTPQRPALIQARSARPAPALNTDAFEQKGIIDISLENPVPPRTTVHAAPTMPTPMVRTRVRA